MVSKNIKDSFLVVLLSLPALASLLHPGLYPSHDAEYHVVRFYEFNKAFWEGVIYPRIAPDLNFGYGVPLFSYVYPLPNYISVFFHLFGSSFIDAFKYQMFSASIIGAIFFYLWVRVWFGRLSAVIAAVFYTYSPYHLLDIYIRGAIGEVWSFAFFPAFLWAITEFINKKTKLFLVLSAIFFALIIFSHNIMAMIFAPFAALYIWFVVIKSSSSRRDFFVAFFPVFFGIGLSAIFWIPAIFEQPYVVGLQMFDFTRHFPQIYQLIFPSWGSGFSGILDANEMSFQIGIANLIVVLLAGLFYLLQIIQRDRKEFMAPLFFLALFALIFYLMTPYSVFLWKRIHFLSFVQFPWRLLSLEILVCSMLAGYVWKPTEVLFGQKKLLPRLILFLLFILLPIWLTTSYTTPAYYLYRDDNYYTQRPNFIDGTNSTGNAFNTIWAHGKPKRAYDLLPKKDTYTFSVLENKTTVKKIEIKAFTSTNILVNTAFFPGWAGYIDDKTVPIKNSDTGLIMLKIPKGTHVILLGFEETPLMRLGAFTSLFCAVFLVFCPKWYRIKAHK